MRVKWSTCAVAIGLTLCPFTRADEPATQPASTQPAAKAPDPVKQSTRIMRQIGQAVMMYANDNKGSMPADLQALAKYLTQGFVDTLHNPRTGAEPGYEYISPGPKIHKVRDPQAVPMLWELDADGKRVEGGLVLYVDGHVESSAKK